VPELIVKKRFISNVGLTNYYPDKIVVTQLDSIINVSKRFSFVPLLIDLCKNYDGMIFLNPSFDWAWRCMVIKIVLLGKIKIVFFDMLLPRPYSIGDYFRAYIKRIVFKFVDRFIFLHKDISGYFRYFRIEKNKCTYVPFKANNIDIISKYQITDNGYLLSCGASYRDYVLLAKALQHYSCHTTVVLPEDNLAGFHHSIIDETLFNDKVTIIRHDFSQESWYKILSECRAVVLPIRSDAIQCAGLSVYLEAMAFGKPVVITEGPATRDLLTEESAAICPADDPVALSEAMKRVMEDENYRMRLIKNGYEYVHSLGGEDRLVKDILKVLVAV
jgi:glycosyltransferase involved in cell wall biosynthesis